MSFNTSICRIPVYLLLQLDFFFTYRTFSTVLLFLILYPCNTYNLDEKKRLQNPNTAHDFYDTIYYFLISPVPYSIC